MLGSGWTETPEPIGTWRGQWFPECTNDLSKNRMRADSNANCVETSSDNFRNDRFLRQNDRKRPRPETIGKFLDQFSIFVTDLCNAVKPIPIRQVNDERIETRSFLRFKDFRDGDRIKRVSSQAVNSFGWQRDDFPFSQELQCAFCRGGLRPPTAIIDRRYNFCFHFGTRAASTASVCFFRKASRFVRIFLSESARIAPARSAAFFAPAEPIASVPTGIPPGICAIERSESSPRSADDGIGTPRTGRRVSPATTPARCAALPAPVIMTCSPRSSALRAKSAVASGVRCAERMRCSLAMPSSLSVSTQWRIVSQSDLLPIRTATRGFGLDIRHARNANSFSCRILERGFGVHGSRAIWNSPFLVDIAR